MYPMEKPGKRKEIVRAALALIAVHGFHGAPLAMIADRAGVGIGTIYLYFENKDVLIAEIYKDLEDRLSPLIMEGYAPEKPIRERFLHLGTALLRYFIYNPLDFRYLEQFHNSPYGVTFRRDNILGQKRNYNVCRELLEEGMDGQGIKNLPLVTLFALAFGPLLTVAREHILGFVSLDDSLIARTVEACWDGIRR
jgi:AcrR family transcriptional regulator